MDDYQLSTSTKTTGSSKILEEQLFISKYEHEIIIRCLLYSENKTEICFSKNGNIYYRFSLHKSKDHNLIDNIFDIIKHFMAKDNLEENVKRTLQLANEQFEKWENDNVLVKSCA